MTNATSRETSVAYDEDTYVERRRPRRRRSGWGFLFALLLLLVAIAVVADRVAAKFAGDELKAQLVAELDQRDVQYETLDVGIGGFPFLTQVAAGHYNGINIDMTQVRLRTGNGPAVTLPELHVTAKGVSADTAEVVSGTAKVTAEQVTGDAVVAYSTLETLIDYSRFNLTNVKFEEANGALRATGTATISGVKVPITASAAVAVKDGQFTISLRDATAATLPVPAIVTNYLSNLAQQAAVARLPKLPFGLTLDSASVQPNGLALAATGANVPLIG
jgi:hypothetical protein